MNFLEFQDKFPTQRIIIDYFINLQYRNGSELGCPHCGSTHLHHRKDKPKLFMCLDCDNSFSIFKDVGNQEKETRVDTTQETNGVEEPRKHL